VTRVRIIAALFLVLTVGSGWTHSQAPGMAAARPSTVELRSGDRVVLLGDSLFERENRLGVIETALIASHPEKTLTFRNLGWSGDTVRGEARAYFGQPADGYAELLKSVDLVKPTVIFVSYGANESFDGDAGLDSFISDYGRLITDLSSRTKRIVLLTPLPADGATSPLPRADLDERNRVLLRYSEAIRALAASRGLASIDMFSAMRASMSRSGPPLYENGIHLTESGYVIAAGHIAARTAPSTVLDVPALAAAIRQPAGDPRGRRIAELRALVVRKNDLFFHRSRPANVTYLYLFRQREQGNNAVEIPRFDPLVEEADGRIQAARKALGAASSSGNGRAGGAR